MKKVIICTDLEGVSLVDSVDMMEGEGYLFACRRLEADLNAAIAGCFDAGADEVWFLDGHGGGKNIDRKAVDHRAREITNFNDPAIFKDCIAYMEVGLHARAGTQNAFLEHTQSSKTVHDYRLNGVSYGELAQGAAYCGAYGVPFVMVSGDDALCAEAAALLPGICCASVKKAIGRNRAVCVSEDEALRRIREAACLGVRRAADMKPWKIDLPAEIEFSFHFVAHCDEMEKLLPHWTRKDGWTLVKTIDEIVTYMDLNLA